MFSLMTALLSPKVVETLQGRKDVLSQTLQERAGVLCVQPSHGVCMLQGEWECMKKAHVVLEELCLEAQRQKNSVASLMHNGRSSHVSKEEVQKAFGLGNQSPEEGHYKLYEEMQQRQMAYAQWAALNHQMVAGAHLAQQMAAQMQHLETLNVPGKSDGRQSVNHIDPPPREDTPLNLKKELEPPRLEKYGGSQEDGESYRDEDGENNLTIATSDEETSRNCASPNSQRQTSGGVKGDSMDGGSSKDLVRPPSRDEEGGLKRSAEGEETTGHNNRLENSEQQQNGDRSSEPMDTSKSELNPLQAMTQALANSPALRDNAKYADPKAGMTAEGMLSAQLMSGLPYGRQFRGAQNSPVPDELAMRSQFMSQNYRLATMELALLERRMQDPHNKGVTSLIDAEEPERDRYTPDRQKNFPTPPIMPPKERPHKDLSVWPPRTLQEVKMDEDYDEQFYKCSACFAGFSSAEALQEHMMNAHTVGPGMVADKNSSLLTISQTADAYCCPVCGKFYKSSQRLREHIPLHDKNYQRPTYPCPACHKTFTYRHNMKVHYQKIHKGREPPKRHECTICGQKFHKPVYLRNHLLRHKEQPEVSNPLDYTLAPSPLSLPPMGAIPGTGVAQTPAGTESAGGEDTSASGSPGTTTSEWFLDRLGSSSSYFYHSAPRTTAVTIWK